MKKIALLFCVLTLVLPLHANHIVGGEIEFITIEPGRYRINLIQYRDEAQTENTPDDIDGSVTVSLFSNKDNRFITELTLPFTDYSDVSYTKPECAIASLKTSRVIYSLEVNLNPRQFADEEGYYIAWERCCRNSGIRNIVSPQQTGMKYIVEIPPLYKNDRAFVNSSPILLKPLSDYACVNQLYYTNFTGTDPDGDSLVYKLAVPLNTSVFDALPVTQPKPNLLVTWAPGFSLNNVVPGTQPLRISPRGLLTVNPSTAGLYVFSVVVEEWRNRAKIGEVQRDFQMLVIDGCEPPDPPSVEIQIPGNPDFDPDTDVLTYTVFEEKCFDFIVSNVSLGETISFRAEPVNFDHELDNLFSVSSVFVGLNQESILLTVCAPDCPPIRNAPFIIDLIAADDACPLPQMDTLRLQIQVQPPSNELPVIAPIQNSFFIDEGEVLPIPFSATDVDGDLLSASLEVLGVEEPLLRGFTFEIEEDEPGRIAGTLTWDTDCLEFDFSDRQYFRAGIRVEDADSCLYPDKIIEWIDLNVVLPLNTSPVISTDHPLTLAAFPKDTIAIDLEALDVDGDEVSFSFYSPDIELADVSASFEAVNGAGSASAQFRWILSCEQVNLLDDETIRLYFLADDADKCKVKNIDTIAIDLQIDLSANTIPYFGLEQQVIRQRINEPFALEIQAFDDDSQDTISLGFHPSFVRPRSPSLTFSNVKGVEQVTGLLEWTPECDLLDQGETEQRYELNFLVRDNSCSNAGFKSLKLFFEVYEDREAFNDFLPPNAFSPNGDGMNDTYSLTNLAEQNQNLPQDVCDNEFEYFTVFDRNGKTIYTTKSRDFVFTGNNAEAGTYFYVVKFSKNEYKGFLQILY